MIAYGDNFLAGSLLTLLMPTLLLIALVVWYLIAIRRVPKDTPDSAAALPTRETVAAAGTDVHEINPAHPDDPPV